MLSDDEIMQIYDEINEKEGETLKKDAWEYAEAISFNYMDCYTILQKRIERLAKLVSLEAPIVIITNEIRLILKADYALNACEYHAPLSNNHIKRVCKRLKEESLMEITPEECKQSVKSILDKLRTGLREKGHVVPDDDFDFFMQIKDLLPKN